MLDGVSFYWGVLAGHLSMIAGYWFAYLWRSKIQSIKPKEKAEKPGKPGKTVCPFCKSGKIAYTDLPGIVWCRICKQEFKNGGR